MALTRCSALEAAESGVRINAVSPSIALHDFLKKPAAKNCWPNWPTVKPSAAPLKCGKSPTS